MADPRLTDERLRTWLQSQAERERLCIALLPMFGAYRDVRPRRPRGGPDGGRDIEATLDGGLVWGAVGFQEHASDSRDSRTAAVRKYYDDLDSACGENSQLHGFAFFTNVDFPPSMVDELERAARTRGLSHVDIFHRERLREKLDSTPGLALRLQFLSIPMSIEEQTAFVHHLSKSQDARLAELAILLDAIQGSVSKLEATATATMDSLRIHTERTIATITGGESYCKLAFGPDGTFVIHIGDFPLYDVTVRIVDLNKTPRDWQGTNVRIGDLIPRHAVGLNVPFAWSPGDTRRANLFFTARNGSFIQLLRGYKVHDKWVWAEKVVRDGSTLEEKVPEDAIEFNPDFK